MIPIKSKEDLLRDARENIQYILTREELTKSVDILVTAFQYVGEEVKLETLFSNVLDKLLKDDEAKALVVMGYIRRAFEDAE